MAFRPFRVEIDGATLVGERRQGLGVPLVLIHGFGGSRHDWEPLIGKLPPELPLITYDQRGFGESIAPSGTPFSHSDDLRALLDNRGVGQANICGVSLGGATALNFSLNHPELVRRLVLVSPLMVGWSWTADWVDRWKQIGRAARGGDIDAARELWWQHPLFASTRASPAAPLLHASIAAFHGRQWVNDDQRAELPEVDRLTDLTTPTLVLTGALDTEDFRLIADLIAAAGQNVARIDHADAGHMLHLEITGALAGEITRFLST